MTRAPDREIWDHAKEAGFLVVSKDNDFQQMSFVFGPPPKVIWIRRGNCSVEETEKILRSSSGRIHEFENDQVAAYLILS
jgi:predicted nuclease of predicted toxin-antitoxin system